MQIVIPMSGFGERFRRVGYDVPKPLIEVEGKPIVAHVIDMFPGEKDFIFICNQDHLDDPLYKMEATLKNYCPSGRIVGIRPHKLGPINAVRQIEHMLDPELPVVINYCDFTCYWDWNHFKYYVDATKCAGAIPCYKGFHPHSLGSTNYAYMLEANGWVQDIQEKQPYTDNRMEEYASSGTYYFSSALLMSRSLQSAMEQNLNVGGEYYVSLAYKKLLADGEPVAIYPLQHFMQWGTPEDLVEYKAWSEAFRQLTTQSTINTAPHGTLIIPMAGLGQRFVNEGYSQTKPLIPVSGRSMVSQATHDLPPAEQYVFVLRTDMVGYEDVISELKVLYPTAIVKTINHVTEGQACSAAIGLECLAEQQLDKTTPITIGACDNGALYDPNVYRKLLDDDNVDVIVWGVRGYPNALRHPKMFGWMKVNESGMIDSISVKTPLDKPESDPVVLGTFTFCTVESFNKAFERLIARNGRVNGEFYMDSLINDAIALGLKCCLFEVDSYLCWGTPNDLRTFEYWQSCFHKWDSHAYRLEIDSRVPKNKVNSLVEKYQAIVPALPKLDS